MRQNRLEAGILHTLNPDQNRDSNVAVARGKSPFQKSSLWEKTPPNQSTPSKIFLIYLSSLLTSAYMCIYHRGFKTTVYLITARKHLILMIMVPSIGGYNKQQRIVFIVKLAQSKSCGASLYIRSRQNPVLTFAVRFCLYSMQFFCRSRNLMDCLHLMSSYVMWSGVSIRVVVFVYTIVQTAAHAIIEINYHVWNWLYNSAIIL